MTVMVDLEGTLSDHTDRLATLQRETTDNPRDRNAWKKYYKGLPDDEPRHQIMIMVREWTREGIPVLIYSTRFINKYNHEEEWLRGHELWEHVSLIQREAHETKIKGPDLVLKWASAFKPDLVIDDREDVRLLLHEHLPELPIYAPEDFTPPEAA